MKKKVTSHCKWSTPPLVPFSSSRRGHREQWRRVGGVGRDRILAGSSTWPGRARPRLRGACARVRPGRPSRGKGMGDGGWPGGAHVAVARRGGDGPARASTRHPSPPGAGPTPPLSCTCCAVVRRSSPTASGEDARILCGGGFAAREFHQLQTHSNGSVLRFFLSSSKATS